MKGFREIAKILNRTYIPNVNTIQERTFIPSTFKNKLKNLNLVSYLQNKKVNEVFNTFEKGSSNDIYNSIKYKNLGGIKVEIKGRLTKRYRADRSIYLLR
jgi:hypothetical protein